MERPDQSANSDGVAWLLLGYLCSHPDAKDTAEGIETWWLRAHGVDVNDRDVKEALTDLVSRDWLIRRGSLSGRQIYGLNQARRAELQELLESRK
ncbi:MAG: hypothetical protein OEV04_08870 [Nitrospira sp.]|nr:hypothetical protein [Nitrospira sp.]